MCNYNCRELFFKFIKKTKEYGLKRSAIKIGKFVYKVFYGCRCYYICKRYDNHRNFQYFSDKREFPLFSIIVPLYNTPIKFLHEMIKSVLEQKYEKWELCLIDASDIEHNYVGEYCLSLNDCRIKYKKIGVNLGISENTNECIKMAEGDYLALLDHDDILHEAALYEYAININESGADMIYCDEASFTDSVKKLFRHTAKGKYNYDKLCHYNYITHFLVFKIDLINSIGNYRSQFDGSQDYDMILRITEVAKNIQYIPQILYYWRAHKNSVAYDSSVKPYAVEAGKKALEEHFKRTGKHSLVEIVYTIDGVFYDSVDYGKVKTI